MHITTKWIKVVALCGALVLAGAAGASAASGHVGPFAQPGAAKPAHFAPRALVDTSTESKYTPIAPCRIVDTRVKGGAIKAGNSRAFAALGSGSFAAQGGTSCDIPTAATAVTGSIIAVDAAGGGHADIWATGSTDPGASFINFAPHPTISASGTIPIGAGATNFVVGVFSNATQVVIQLTGYFVPPLAARVKADGSLLNGSRVTATSLIMTGQYEVDFDRDVSNCYYAANAFTGGDSVIVEPRSNNHDGVFLLIENNAGTIVNDDFYLTVIC